MRICTTETTPVNVIRNWRSGRRDAYPRYENVKSRFDEDFKAFQDFASREKLGPIEVNQCEITYVNHIAAGEGWDSHEDLDKVLRIWNHPGVACPGSPEDVGLHVRFPMKDAAGAPIGRLHVDLQAAVRNSDGRQIYVLNLTARGMIGKSTEFFDLGREWIVRTFAEITTPEMHKIWGRKQ